jgi:tetratricopeptide (TPR) repeat protein
LEKRSLKKRFLFGIVILLFAGCSQKVNIKSVKSPKVLDTDIKQIKLVKLKHDNINQTNFIYAKLSNFVFDNKKYFKVISQNDIKSVLKEQRLNDSGLVNTDEVFEGLQSAKSILSGKVSNHHTSSSYRVKRTDYSKCLQYKKTKKGKEYCAKYREYSVGCKLHKYSVNTFIKLAKVSNGKTIFGKNYNQESEISKCKDEVKVLPKSIEVYQKLAKQISNDILIDLAPSYINRKVVVLDDLDIDLSSQNEKGFENALELLEKNRIDKANMVLYRLNREINNKSFVILYNLAITYESLGNLQEAYELLQKADSLANFLNEDISMSLKRVSHSIKEQNIVNMVTQ